MVIRTSVSLRITSVPYIDDHIDKTRKQLCIFFQLETGLSAHVILWC